MAIHRERAITSAASNIDCPWFKAALAKHRSRTCRNPVLKNLADLRRHAARGRRPHLPFLRQCRTCKRTLTNKGIFENKHGNDGEICVDRPIDDNPHVQWMQLYDIACEQLDGKDKKRQPHKSCSVALSDFSLTSICSNITHSHTGAIGSSFTDAFAADTIFAINTT
jgi:hypothetical protein